MDSRGVKIELGGGGVRCVVVDDFDPPFAALGIEKLGEITRPPIARGGAWVLLWHLSTAVSFCAFMGQHDVVTVDSSRDVHVLIGLSDLTEERAHSFHWDDGFAPRRVVTDEGELGTEGHSTCCEFWNGRQQRHDLCFECGGLCRP